MLPLDRKRQTRARWLAFSFLTFQRAALSQRRLALILMPAAAATRCKNWARAAAFAALPADFKVSVMLLIIKYKMLVLFCCINCRHIQIGATFIGQSAFCKKKMRSFAFNRLPKYEPSHQKQKRKRQNSMIKRKQKRQPPTRARARAGFDAAAPCANAPRHAHRIVWPAIVAKLAN